MRRKRMKNSMRIYDKTEPLVVVPESLVLAGLAVEGLPLKVSLMFLNENTSLK